jgi:hypothetical protein
VAIPCKGIRLFIKRRERAEKVLDDPYRIEKTVIPLVGTIEDDVYQNQTFKKSYKVVSLEEVDSEITDLESAKEVIKNLLKGTATEVQHIDRYYQVKFKLKTKNEIREASFPSYNLNYNPNRIKGLAKAYYLSKNRDSDVSGNYSLIAKILTDLHWKYKKKQAVNAEDTTQQKYDDLAGILRSVVDEKSVLINRINEKINMICCEDKRLQIDFIDIEQPYKSAFVSKKDGDKLLLPDNLGSGFNILIAYALFSYVAELEKVPIVLIIDEPELHLHCDWQKKMYNLFSNEESLQVVYSTQSESFISMKKWKQIRFVKDLQIYPKEETLSEQITATDGQTAPRSAYLDDIANRNLHISLILRENLELFFAKKCILVEGPSEKYALPILLALHGCEFDKYSVSIIPAWGKTKVKNYQMICKCFGIDYYTIFDHDIDENENTAIETNAETGRLTQFSTSFEKKLGINQNDDKFQKLVSLVDGLSDINSLDQEVKDCLTNLTSFITT